MKPDLIKVKYNDETILTVEDQELADNFVRCMLTFNSEMTDVTLAYENDTKRKAKKFVLTETGAMTISSVGMNLLFPKGTVIYIFKK